MGGEVGAAAAVVLVVAATPLSSIRYIDPNCAMTDRVCVGVKYVGGGLGKCNIPPMTKVSQCFLQIPEVPFCGPSKSPNSL